MPQRKKITAPKKRSARANDLELENLPPGSLTPDPRNARRHTNRQVHKLARIIREFGWSAPIIIDENNMILAGHARCEAAMRLGMKRVPCVRLTHLTEAQKKALAIADNKLTDESSFDDEALRTILIELTDIDFEVELTGFETGEIDVLIDGGSPAKSADPADTFALPNPDQSPVTRLGDLWLLGKSRLLCGNSLELDSYEQLLGSDRAHMVFTDPPYNLKIAGNVSGLGRHKHREFIMASGELSEVEFRSFLTTAMANAAAFSVEGSIAFYCMDWRHIRTLIEAGGITYDELKNICVWIKSNGGMGSLYRSQHELICAFKKGKSPHKNNVQLGKYGRSRSNVWQYAGCNAFGPTRDADLALHATVKPIHLVADAIRDVSKRGDIVLDPFSGSASTILAAERTGRRAAAIELDPLYVDTGIRRWEAFAGQAATLAADGRTFAEVGYERLSEAPVSSPAVAEA
jgi:DNA modification methylase